MATGTFPYIGAYGSSITDKVDEFIHEFGDNEYSGYLRGAVQQGQVSLVVKSTTKAKMIAIRAFWNAHKLATTKNTKEFFLYSPLEATAVDLALDNHVGRYTAIFTDNEVTWVRDGRCRFSCTIGVKILAAAP